MGKKRSNKNVSLVNEDGKDFVLKGRRPCLCEASRHNLINNCVQCGRVVCEQEGQGPCFTCGCFVFNKEERNRLLSGTSEAKARIEKLIANGTVLDFMIDKSRKISLKNIAASLRTEALDKAIEHKEKLLQYDRNSVARSQVYDDQMDYFTIRSQNFITDQTRQKINEKVDYLVENKFNKVDKITLDLVNMSVQDHTESVIKDIDKEHRQLEALSEIKTDYVMLPSANFLDDDSLTKNAPPAIYIPPLESSNKPSSSSNQTRKLPKTFLTSGENAKVQDSEIEIIEDRGMCLAMHQPYASLLVAGIKRFEGRAWFSNFKGRLWIYAAQRRPSSEEIDTVENLYRNLGHQKFPMQYPTGVIVGCVTVEQCLPGDLCLQQYPNCEVESPYLFVCQYPIAFSKPLPVLKGGGNRIYKLEPNVHKACKQMLGFGTNVT